MTRDARQVLAELELISHGKCASYNSSGAGESTAVLPQGESRPPHEYWRGRFNAASTDYELADLVRQARDELEAWRVRQEPAEDCWNERDAILKDGEGFEASVVARRFARSVTYVMRLRAKDDREAEFGLPTRFAAVKDNSSDRVQNLASQGCTLRQIAMQTGLHKTQVQRMLKAAA
jgi:hypothetical protein